MGIARRFQAISAPHTDGRKQKPGEQPEEIEGQAKNRGINAIPQGDGEADGEEWDQREEN